MGQVFGLYQVDQSTVAVKEKFGKFSTVLSPGCHCVPWCCGVNVAGVMSLRIQQLDVRCETKSKVWCFFSPLSTAHPPACLLGSFISGLVRMNQSSGVGNCGVCVSVMFRTMSL